MFPALAPTKEMLRMDFSRYRTLYFRTILGRLDPKETWDQLHALAGSHEPVLLCWETLRKPGEWCHRRMAAEWFQAELGEEVPEL